MLKRNRPLFPVMLLFFIILGFARISAADVLLNLPVKTQEHSEWCWVGTSQAVLAYYGTAVNQCDIANWAWSRNDCCGDSAFEWSSPCNQPNYLSGATAISGILSHWGVESAIPTDSHGSDIYVLSKSEVVSQIDSGRPFVMRFGWTGGGGHFLDGRGYDQQGVYLDYMDPLPGNGYTRSLYTWVVQSDDHSWTDTLVVTTATPYSSFYVSFPSDGLYKYDGSALTLLTATQPESIVASIAGFYAYFTSDGLYSYNGAWTKITTGQPQGMAVSGATLYASFASDGLYKYDGSVWTLLTTALPQSMAVSGAGVLYASFPSDGLYKYDGTWTLLTRSQPASIVASSGGIYAYFPSDGLYRYNGTWTRITTGQPQSMVVSGTTLYSYFASDGLYKYDGSWTLLTTTQPAGMIGSASGIYACFTSDGLYRYNGSWTKITTGQPQGMAVSGTTLYPYFASDGLYKYNGSWTLLTRTQPQIMVPVSLE